MKRHKQNKKALATMVSYVLLVIITLALAAGVYSWLKFQANIPTDEGKCPDDISLTIKNYNCNQNTSTISLNLENKGFFNIDGFFIKAATDTTDLPTIQLSRTDKADPIEGRYDFEPNPLSPGDTKTTTFSYSNILPKKLEKIQLQPFIYNEERLSSCSEAIINLKIDDEKNC